MRSYRINKSKLFKVVLVIIILIFFHYYSNESRGFAMPVEVGYTYQQSEQGEKIKKDIISDVKMREFCNGIFSGVSGVFFIDNNAISFNAIKLNLGGTFNDKEKHLYNGSGRYKNKKYDLDIITKWNGFGATMFGTLYDKSDNSQIEFEIN